MQGDEGGRRAGSGMRLMMGGGRIHRANACGQGDGKGEVWDGQRVERFVQGNGNVIPFDMVSADRFPRYRSGIMKKEGKCETGARGWLADWVLDN